MEVAWLVWGLWLRSSCLFVCLFSFLRFFLVTIFSCYDEQWLVVNGGRVAGLGARSKPRGECHRFMAEQLPAPPAPPHYPKLSSIPASTFNSLLSLLQIHFGNQLLAIDDISTWIPKRETVQLPEDLTLTIPQCLDDKVSANTASLVPNTSKFQSGHRVGLDIHLLSSNIKFNE